LFKQLELWQGWKSLAGQYSSQVDMWRLECKRLNEQIATLKSASAITEKERSLLQSHNDILTSQVEMLAAWQARELERIESETAAMAASKVPRQTQDDDAY